MHTPGGLKENIAKVVHSVSVISSNHRMASSAARLQSPFLRPHETDRPDTLIPLSGAEEFSADQSEGDVAVPGIWRIAMALGEFWRYCGSPRCDVHVVIEVTSRSRTTAHVQ